ncbi:MAG: hypothetical protein OWU32_10655 [Firmicutes bacterium]|nr:hypothetical protein [Bacillota bacterium]
MSERRNAHVTHGPEYLGDPADAESIPHYILRVPAKCPLITRPHELYRALAPDSLQ